MDLDALDSGLDACCARIRAFSSLHACPETAAYTEIDPQADPNEVYELLETVGFDPADVPLPRLLYARRLTMRYGNYAYAVMVLAERIQSERKTPGLADSIHNTLDQTPLGAAVEALDHAITELENAARDSQPA
jgi:hypothetical protein